ncbi:GNAT family N-acetyltransferase [Halofilum ochraceum]|uniref:GNAT family N-acetyltransferase n=1 Tax=Halofilum ochraceum TaxID=1611323 RepID=UPI000946C8EA|nr:GNAT family N-acetyltransferase [Halofilum ochraceum]
MNILNTIRLTLTDLRQTVHVRYGGGVRGYAEFFYISLLRTNTFIIFVTKSTGCSVYLPDPESLSFTRNDHKRLNEFRQSRDLPKEFYCDQTHDAHDFILGFWEGEVAYIHWIFHENAKTRFLKIGEDCAEIGYMVTLPEFRGNKICSHALTHTVQALCSEGVRSIFCVVHDKNIASIKAVKRAGFRESGKSRTLGPFNMRHDVTSEAVQRSRPSAQ